MHLTLWHIWRKINKRTKAIVQFRYFFQATNENANPTQRLVDFSTSTLSDLMTSTSTSTCHILAVSDAFRQSKIVGISWDMVGQAGIIKHHEFHTIHIKINTGIQWYTMFNYEIYYWTLRCWDAENLDSFVQRSYYRRHHSETHIKVAEILTNQKQTRATRATIPMATSARKAPWEAQ